MQNTQRVNNSGEGCVLFLLTVPQLQILQWDNLLPPPPQHRPQNLGSLLKDTGNIVG